MKQGEALKTVTMGGITLNKVISGSIERKVLHPSLMIGSNLWRLQLKLLNPEFQLKWIFDYLLAIVTASKYRCHVSSD